MKTIFLALLSILAVFPGIAGAPPSDEAIIHAFLESPEIAYARDQALDKGYEASDVQIVDSNFLCGVAGCQSSYLVIQKLSYHKTNPNSRSLMALVHIGPKGMITRVERVHLVPYKESTE